MPTNQSETKRWKITEILTFATLIVAIGGIGITWIVAQDKIKRLEIHFLSPREFIQPNSKQVDELTIQFQGKQVVRPWLLSGQLRNSGDLPIVSSDIEFPLTLAFEKAKILTATVRSTNPTGIEAKMLITASTITLHHGLLNPGDSSRFPQSLHTRCGVIYPLQQKPL